MIALQVGLPSLQNRFWRDQTENKKLLSIKIYQNIFEQEFLINFFGNRHTCLESFTLNVMCFLFLFFYFFFQFVRAEKELLDISRDFILLASCLLTKLIWFVWCFAQDVQVRLQDHFQDLNSNQRIVEDETWIFNKHLGQDISRFMQREPIETKRYELLPSIGLFVDINKHCDMGTYVDKSLLDTLNVALFHLFVIHQAFGFSDSTATIIATLTYQILPILVNSDNFNSKKILYQLVSIVCATCFILPAVGKKNSIWFLWYLVNICLSQFLLIGDIDVKFFI